MMKFLFNRETIKYKIFSCSSKQNFVVVEGYAFSTNSNDIDFQIVDQNNNKVESIYARRKIFNTGNDNKDYSGFFIKFNIDSNKKYFLIIRNNRTSIKINLSKQLKKTFVVKSLNYSFQLLSSTKIKYLFKNIVYILKNKNNINIKNTIRKFSNQHIGEKELLEQQNTIFAYMPKVSAICNNVSEKTIKSLKKQSYKDIELCCIKNDDINKLINSSNGEILVFIEQNTILEPNTIFEIVKEFNINKDVDFVYCDEDKKINNKYTVCLKDNFSLDLLRTHNYIGNFFAVKRNITKNIDAFVQTYDYILKCIEQCKKVYHIPKILTYTQDKQANYNSMDKRIIENHLKRCNLNASVLETEQKGYYTINYELKSNDLVSIIILNKDNKEQLETCIDSILEKTKYKNYEIIIVENNSSSEEIFKYYKSLENNKKIKIVTYNEDFNYSKLNNYAVQFCNGKYLVFLNNDTQVIEPAWLEIMLSHCQRDNVGIVGAKLLYPNNTIQHYGITFGDNNLINCNFVNMNYKDTSNDNKLNLQQNIDAVTGACCMIYKELFNEVLGFDENLAISFNDIDLCIRVNKLNKLIVLDPRILLYHYESKTRGYESTIEKIKRLTKEEEYLKNKFSFRL